MFYDSFDRDSFEIAKSYYKGIKTESNKELNPIYILVRSKYELNKTTQDNWNGFVSDEEALEFADKNNMLFFHLSFNEKNETGFKELFENIINEYFRRKKTDINEDDKI